MKKTTRKAGMALTLALVACGAAVDGNGSGGGGGHGGASGSPGGAPASPAGPPTDKLDLLFVVDNSAGMATKQTYLRHAIADLVDRLVRPRCLDEQGRSVGRAELGGSCSLGTPEFLPLTDLHVGFISSSLGARGGDQCGATEPTRHNDDGAHLLGRVRGTEGPVLEASPHPFVAWLPPVPSNAGKSRDPKVVGTSPLTDASTFIAAAQRIMDGIGQDGCGYESPMEAAYRFLVQPDPYERIVKVADTVRYVGYDFKLLAERKAFLRPDSAVAVVLLTDENESNVAPMALGGRSWFFADSKRVRPGTAACAMAPGSGDCTSCYLSVANGDPGCQRPLQEDTDHPNVRFFDMKRRFGIDPRYPVERYARGLSETLVPHRDSEYEPCDGAGCEPFAYTGSAKATCRNPLFASTLPSADGEELCELAPGPRTPDKIFFTVIGGVPWQLLTEAPDDLSATNGAPYKTKLGDAEYRSLLGEAPAAHGFDGQHPLMRESLQPREGASADGAHTRDWNTEGRNVQYACTFELPEPVDCALRENVDFCDCSEPTDAPVCSLTDRKVQIRGVASPSTRPIALAQSLGDRGLVASICPREPRDRASSAYGYRPVMDQLVSRMAAVFKK